MKYFYLLFSLLLATGTLLSQPVLSQSDIGFQIGDVHTVDSTSYVDMSSQVGANMTWNLNDLELLGTYVSSTVVDASDTPNAGSFPGSTIARSIEIDEFILDQYFSFDGNSMQHHGTSVDFNGTTVTSLYTNPEIAFPVPMIYNDSGSDSYVSSLLDGPGGEVNSSGVIDWDVPGYGTLLVNDETYSDVLMYRFVRLDTTSSTFGGFSFNVYSEETTYAFMMAGIHYPIVLFTEITSEDDFTPPATTYEASVLISQTTGLASNEDIVSNIQVYPNPSPDGRFTLDLSLEKAEDLTIEIFDIGGRSIYQKSSTELPGRMRRQYDLSDHMESGIYLLQIRSSSGQQTLKIQKN